MRKVPTRTEFYALRNALRALLAHVDSETCRHEDTKRGGTNWTICESCGEEWADDRGGFQPDKDAPAVACARKVIDRTKRRKEAPCSP